MTNRITWHRIRRKVILDYGWWKLDDRLKLSLLLDFYGKMLTNRQYEMLDMHYNLDYSLSEIALEYNITRQGAFDNIRRGRATLIELEDKLKLCSRFYENMQVSERVLEYLAKIDRDGLDEESRQYLDKIKQEVDKLS